MSDFDEFDSLLGTLREPATPAELASERAMVDLMVKTQCNPKGNIMFSSRRTRVATFIAAGVIGFGGVAAAGGLRSSDAVPPVDVPAVAHENEIEVDDVEVEITTTTAAVDDDDAVDDAVDDDDAVDETDDVAEVAPPVGQEPNAGVDDLDTEFDESTCLPGNHGKTVRAVAHGDERFTGVEVRDAAHSQCGKTDADKADDDKSEDHKAEGVDDDADEVEVEDSDEVEVEAPDEADSDDSDEDQASTGGRQTPSGHESKDDRGNDNRGKSGDDD